MLAVSNNPQSSVGMASLVSLTMPLWPLACNGAESASNSFIRRISGWSRCAAFLASVTHLSKLALDRQRRSGKSKMTMPATGGQPERLNSADSILRGNTTLPLNGTMRHLQNRKGIVLFVQLFGRTRVQRNCCSWIIATGQAKFAASFVRNATHILESSKLTQRGTNALWPISQSEAR